MVDPPRKFYRLAPRAAEVRLRAGYYLRCDDVETAACGEVLRLRCSYDPATGGGQAPDGRKVRATIHWVSADHAVEAGVGALRPAVQRPRCRAPTAAIRWSRTTRRRAS